MLQTCLEFVLIQFGLYNPNCFTLKRVFRGFLDYVIRKHHVTRPIFWSFRITKSRKIRYSFFHPLTKENTIPNYKIRKLKYIFGKNRPREETQRVEKVNPIFYLAKYLMIKCTQSARNSYLHFFSFWKNLICSTKKVLVLEGYTWCLRISKVNVSKFYYALKSQCLNSNVKYLYETN